MKNPQGVEPTQFMKKKDSKYAIECNPYYGPVFCGNKLPVINITSKCNKEDSCWIDNDGTIGYECHPEYKSSLFVNTKEPDRMSILNEFAVLDYEVFGIDNYKDYIYDICKYPDIIWEYIETKDISEETLKQVSDEEELLTDLDAIRCENSDIRLKISQYCFKKPSEFLPGTQIVNQQYDAKLREWVGDDHEWKLIYRASEHGYTAESFHEYCDDKGPTLVVIKSSEGWIFGGYTTRSWSVDGMYYDMILSSR